MIKLLNRIKDLLMNCYLTVASLALIVLIVSCMVQVIARYFLPSSPPWTEEMARLSFLWFSALGAAVALDRGAHAAITVALDAMPQGLRKATRLVILAGIFALSLLLIHTGFLLGMATKSTPSPSMRMPMIYMNICILFCGLGMAFSSLCSFLNIVTGQENKKEGGEK